MQPYQQRVVEEAADLKSKLDNLDAFIASKTFHTIRSDEQSRLYEQAIHMRAYLHVLDDRIAAFTL